MQRFSIFLVLLSTLLPAAAFSVKAPATRVVSRSAIAQMQFGTGNFDDSQTEGFFLSPIPGQAKARTLALCLDPCVRTTSCMTRGLAPKCDKISSLAFRTCSRMSLKRLTCLICSAGLQRERVRARHFGGAAGQGLRGALPCRIPCHLRILHPQRSRLKWVSHHFATRMMRKFAADSLTRARGHWKCAAQRHRLVLVVR